MPRTAAAVAAVCSWHGEGTVTQFQPADPLNAGVAVGFKVALVKLAFAGLNKRRRPVPEKSKHSRRQGFGKGGAGAGENLLLILPFSIYTT